MRKSLPLASFPSFEIEPDSGSNEWATTRAQRPTYTFRCILTVTNPNEEFGVEYPATIATILSEIMTDPQNLQMRVLNETKWDLNNGLVDTYILDSLVDNISYSASKDGTIRRVEFSWFVKIHETYPESHFAIGETNTPTIIRPRLVSST